MIKTTDLTNNAEEMVGMVGMVGMVIHDNFTDFVEYVVIPQKGANPSHVRLDGKVSGGNRQVVGLFRHQGKTWKVHADSHYEPLMLAYKYIKSNNKDDPFFESSTTTGVGNCLNLKGSVRHLSSKPRFKYLYIYEVFR